MIPPMKTSPGVWPAWLRNRRLRRNATLGGCHEERILMVAMPHKRRLLKSNQYVRLFNFAYHDGFVKRPLLGGSVKRSRSRHANSEGYRSRGIRRLRPYLKPQ